jgi:ABC-type uncharacterized transport system ATPase component
MNKFMLVADSERLQGEFFEIEQRANVICRLLRQSNSTQSQDTLGIEEAIQVAERIEDLARLAQADSSVERRKIERLITRLRNDLQNRINELNDPEIGSAV